MGALRRRAAIAPSVVDQSQDLANQASGGITKLQEQLQKGPLHINQEQLDQAANSVTSKLKASGGKIADGVATGVTTATSMAVTLLMTLVLSFFFMKDGDKFLPLVRRSVGPRAGAHLTEVLARMWAVLGGYIRAQAIVSFIDAACIGLGLVVLGVPLALPLAVLTFFGGFIPIVGAFVAGALAVLVALVAKGATTALIVLLIVLLVQQLEGHILSPIFQSRSMEVHPALVLLGIAVGSETAGVTGAFLAVPTVALTLVALRYVSEQVDLRTGEKDASAVKNLTDQGTLTSASAERDRWRWRRRLEEVADDSTSWLQRLTGDRDKDDEQEADKADTADASGGRKRFPRLRR